MNGTALYDVTSESTDAKHVQRRVEDWEERVNNFYIKISDWLRDGWESRKGTPVVMHEPLMRKYGIAARQIPTLELFNQSNDIVKLEPRGLWILGNNGRIDLKHNGKHYFIVDFAENFEQPDWQVTRADDRFEHEKVTKEWMTRVLQ